MECPAGGGDPAHDLEMMHSLVEGAGRAPSTYVNKRHVKEEPVTTSDGEPARRLVRLGSSAATHLAFQNHPGNRASTLCGYIREPALTPAPGARLCNNCLRVLRELGEEIEVLDRR